MTTFHNQQYRWCSATLSLVASRSFWQTKLSFAPRLCYFSGYLYYIYSAFLTLFAPLIPLTFLTLMPGRVRWDNYLLILPSLTYTMVIFPLWHRCFYSWETRPVRLICGWAHVFALWDLLRGRRVGWQATGSAKAKPGDSPRLRKGLWLWSGGTAFTWTGLALWRMATWSPVNFSPLFIAGALSCSVTAWLLSSFVGPRSARPRAKNPRSVRLPEVVI